MEFRSALPVAVALGSLLGVALANAGPSGSGQASENLPLRPIAVIVPPTVEWDIPIVRNESVEKFVDLFRKEQTDRMALYLKRSGRYEGMIRSKLRERGMPEDLIYLSMLESGFNPTARSRVSAVGLWQFMSQTARNYGLRVDSYVDERRDPERSTDAALRYLEDLYRQFGSWNLAAAAYNTGENRVARIMREVTGSERGMETDFWRIRGRLPRDTREYVPLMFAMALIGKEPAKYGLDKVERWLPIPVDTVEVPGGVNLGVVAKAVRITEEELRSLNPHLVRGMTPPRDSVFPVRIPEGRKGMFAAEFPAAHAGAKLAARAEAASTKPTTTRTASKKPAPATAVRTYKVKRGENLSVIARRHGVSLSSLQRANRLTRRSVLQVGQVLRIPA